MATSIAETLYAANISSNGKHGPPSLPPSSLGVNTSITDSITLPNLKESQEEPKPDVTTLISQQMEYYLSDRNLVKDKFLREQLQKIGGEGYLPLDIFTSFPKMRKISTDGNLIREVIRSSSILSLNLEGNLIKRNVPFVPPTKKKSKKSKPTSTVTSSPPRTLSPPPTSMASITSFDIDISQENSRIRSYSEPPPFTQLQSVTPPAPLITESKTIYVAHIPKGSDKDSIQKIFGVCGNITRVDIPVDKKSGDIKGTSFIEFETEDEAKKAIEFFNDDENLFKQIGVQVRPYKMRKTTSKTEQTETSTSTPSTSSLSSSVDNTKNEDSEKKKKVKIRTNLSASADSLPTKTVTIALPSTNGKQSSTPSPDKSTPTKLSQSQPSPPKESPQLISDQDPKFVHFQRRKSISTPTNDNWEPTNDSLPRRRTRLFDTMENTMLPLRQPKGPDGSKGFSAGRGRFILQTSGM